MQRLEWHCHTKSYIT